MCFYIENLNDEIKEYFKILSNDIPDFLLNYIKAPEIQRIGYIGMNCGTDYTNIFNNKYFYSRLNHSIGVALIIWNFTKNKKQTLAGLLHDIATPSFSHCIDYLHHDYLKQETTETKTEEIIKSSFQIIKLLSQDNISLKDVIDYKKYPIADNMSPRLSADRLEYTLSSGMTFTKVWTLKDINEIYSDLTIFDNEEMLLEIGFNTQKIAEKFVNGASRMWVLFQSNEDKVVMQFWADILRLMIEYGVITENDLYVYSEKEIINLIEHCDLLEIQNIFHSFCNATKVCEGFHPPVDNYSVCIDVKKRYINPLVVDTRLDLKSTKAKKIIYDFLNLKKPPYGWFDFNIDSNIMNIKTS